MQKAEKPYGSHRAHRAPRLGKGISIFVAGTAVRLSSMLPALRYRITPQRLYTLLTVILSEIAHRSAYIWISVCVYGIGSRLHLLFGTHRDTVCA